MREMVINTSQYRLAILTALPKEFAAVEVMLDQYDDITIPGDSGRYTVGIIGLHPVVVTLLPKMGNNPATAVSSNLLYYCVQPDIWQLIFQVARRLNVQVFATTHSWDCIEGFHKAAQEDNLDEGMLIRLEYKKGDVAVTVFDERQLGIATRERIEVR